MKNTIIKTMGGAAIALIIPLLGNQFVEGWNWSWHDFIFAWVFWVVMALSIIFMVRKFSRYKLLVGTVVFFGFAAIWAMLATG